MTTTSTRATTAFARRLQGTHRAALPLLACLALAACDDAPAASRTCGTYRPERAVLVLESDERSASALARLGTDGCLDEAADVALGSDPALALSRGHAFVCNRTQGECFAIASDSLALGATYVATPSGQASPSDAYDLALDDHGRAWIPRFDARAIAVVGSDGGAAGEVDLSSLADADGIPDMEAAYGWSGRVFVALDRLGPDRAPIGPGVVAIVDAQTMKVAGSIPLVGENPFGRLVPVASDPSGATVSVATPGRFDDATCADCGVEIVDLAAGHSTQVLSEAKVGGSITEAVIAGPHEGYAIAAGPEDRVNPTWVVAFDPATGAITRVLDDTRTRPEAERGYYHWGLALDGDRVLVGDRTPGHARIRAYSRADGSDAGGFDVGLYPPIAIAAP